MKRYIAYGSNLNKEQMSFRCPNAEPIGTAVITDYKLIFRRGFLTIEPAKGEYVPVGIWQITETDERALDRYEGYPAFYHKEEMDIPGVGKAMVYIMNDGQPEQQPSNNYFYTVYRGYKDFGIDNRDPLVLAYEHARWGDD